MKAFVSGRVTIQNNCDVTVTPSEGYSVFLVPYKDFPSHTILNPSSPLEEDGTKSPYQIHTETSVLYLMVITFLCVHSMVITIVTYIIDLGN